MAKKNIIRTSKKVASEASAILKNKKSSKTEKAVAASDLSNRRKKTK